MELFWNNFWVSVNVRLTIEVKYASLLVSYQLSGLSWIQFTSCSVLFYQLLLHISDILTYHRYHALVIEWHSHPILSSLSLWQMAFARTLLTHRACELLRLMNMWKVISNCHQSQMKAVEAMRRLDNSAASEPTTSSHRHSTAQLEAALMTSVNFYAKLPNFLSSSCLRFILCTFDSREHLLWMWHTLPLSWLC